MSPTLALATPFRLFFLLAATLAATSIPAWILTLTQRRELSTNLGAMGWHAHEMLFGYTGAVLAGFLLTAARSWTGRATLSGAPLGGLLVLWMLGRAAALQSSALPAALPPLIDGAFFAVVAVAIAVPIIASRSWRNLGFPGIMIILGSCDVVIHCHALGWLPPWSARAFDVAIDAIVLIIIVFAGRIIPLFTAKATGAPVRGHSALDWLGLATILLLGLARALAPQHEATYLLAVVTGFVNSSRLIGWGGQRTLRSPVLWILHAGWLVLCVAIALSGVAGFVPFAPPGALLHLLTIGGIGTMTLGMMARVSLGHTGRKLQVPRLVAAGFVLMALATAARVSASIVNPVHYERLLWLASAAWSLAFVAFLISFTSILLSPRPDGKPG